MVQYPLKLSLSLAVTDWLDGRFVAQLNTQASTAKAIGYHFAQKKMVRVGINYFWASILQTFPLRSRITYLWKW